MRVVEELGEDLQFYSDRQRQISIRHVSNDELIAIIEIISPANKQSHREFERFMEKAIETLRRGIHLMVLDPFPPGSTNPHGLHFEIAATFGREVNTPVLDEQRDRCLAAYDAGELKAYVEPMSVGDELIAMPLFLKTGRYINVDLATTYDRAFEFFPQRFKRVLVGE